MRFDDEQRLDIPEGKTFGERLAPWVVVSLLVHALLMGILAPTILESPLFSDKEAAKKEELAKKTLSTRLLSLKPKTPPTKAEMAMAKAQAQPAPAQPAPKEQPTPENAVKLPGQVVDIARPDKQEVPDKADYVSEFDSKVQKQSRARKMMPSEHVAPHYDKGEVKAPEGPIGHEEGKLVVGQPEKMAVPGEAGSSKQLLFPNQKAQAPSALPTTRDGTVPLPGGKEFKQGLQGNADRLAMIFKPGKTGQEGIESAPGGINIPKSYMPDLGLTFRDGGAPMNDHLRGVEEGDATWLNTKSFKYAGYFNRIKLKISQRWHPDQAQQKYDPTLSIYGTQNRYTVISIELDGTSGALTDSQLQRSSGADYLDREALAAVQSAAPFPNPPKGLAETDGHIRFPFGFFFELSRFR